MNAYRKPSVRISLKDESIGDLKAQMKEVEISLKSMFFYLLSKWKSLVVGMIIGAILAGVFGIYGACASPSTSGSPSTSASTSTSTITSTSVTYLVETDSPENLISVHQTLLGMLSSSDYYGYISSVTHQSVADLKAMITITGVGSKINTISYTYEMATMNPIVISITDVDKDIAEQIIKSTEIYIQNRSDELIKKGFDHNLVDMDVYKYDGETVIENEVEPENVSELSAENSELISSVKGFSIKHVLVGFIIGFIIVACWHFMIYIFANKLEEDDDFEKMYGLYLIGMIPGKEYGKLLYKAKNLGKRTFDPEESSKLIVAKIKMLAEKNEIKDLGIIGCNILKESKDISEKLISYLKETGVDAAIIDNALYDENSVKALKAVDNVILLEKAGETFRTEVIKELEMARQFGIKVHGIAFVGR